MKYVILAGLLLLVLVEYALMVVASDADDREEEFWKEWKEKVKGADDE